MRCSWCLRDQLYMDYHDLEWGRPVHNDSHLFEMLVLESFQAGLSWYTILSKRTHFRNAFSGFNVEKVAQFGEADVARLMLDAGIVRNRLKILASIGNAAGFIKIQHQFGSFAAYIWGFTNHQVIDNRPKLLSDIPSISPESKRMAADLKSRGFKFMGSTVCYAFMQGIGMVNDHLLDCHCRKQDKMAHYWRR